MWWFLAACFVGLVVGGLWYAGHIGLLFKSWGEMDRSRRWPK